VREKLVDMKQISSWKHSIRRHVISACLMSVVVVPALVFGGARFGPALGAEETPVVLQDIRPDIRDLLYALAYRIQGLEFETAGSVAFDSGIGPVLDPTGLSYKYLNLQSVALLSLEDKGNDSYALVAVLKFADVMSKRAYLTVGAHYTARNGAVFVEHVIVEPFYSGENDVQILMAPSSALPDFAEFQALPLEEVYMAMLEHGSSPENLFDDDDQETQRVTVLVLDRIRAQDKVLLDLSINDGATPVLHSLAQLNRNGWAYLIVDADFSTSDSTVYGILQVENGEPTADPKYLGQFGVGP